MPWNPKSPIFVMSVSPFSFMSWNCQGCGHPCFNKFVKEYCVEYKPDILSLVETRISGNNADRVIKKLCFEISHRIKARGFAGGLWLLWNNMVEIEILVNHA